MRRWLAGLLLVGGCSTLHYSPVIVSQHLPARPESEVKVLLGSAHLERADTVALLSLIDEKLDVPADQILARFKKEGAKLGGNVVEVWKHKEGGTGVYGGQVYSYGGVSSGYASEMITRQWAAWVLRTR